MNFTTNQDYSLEKVNQEIDAAQPFCKWLHYVSMKDEIKRELATDLRPKYLLQVWSRTGICIYEQPLKKPVKRWNLFQDNFLFMENDSNIKMLKCGQSKNESVVITYSFTKMNVDNKLAQSSMYMSSDSISSSGSENENESESDSESEKESLLIIDSDKGFNTGIQNDDEIDDDSTLLKNLQGNLQGNLQEKLIKNSLQSSVQRKMTINKNGRQRAQTTKQERPVDLEALTQRLMVNFQSRSQKKDNKEQKLGSINNDQNKQEPSFQNNAFKDSVKQYFKKKVQNSSKFKYLSTESDQQRINEEQEQQDSSGSYLLEQEEPKRTIGYQNKMLFIIETFKKASYIKYYSINPDNDRTFVDLSVKKPKFIFYLQNQIQWKIICDKGDGEILLIAEDNLANNYRLLFYNIALKTQQNQKPDRIPTNAIQKWAKDFKKQSQTEINEPNEEPEVILCKLGLRNTFKKTGDQVPRVKNLHVVFYKDSNSQYFMTALALRGMNIITSYADCVLLDTWTVVSSKEQELVVDVEIGTDLDFYMIRALTLDSSSTQSNQKPNQLMQKCKIAVRDSISKSHFSKCKSSQRLDTAIHMRIAPYFQLYSGFLNAGSYFLVTHGKFITLYDLRTHDLVLSYCGTYSLSSEIMGLAQIDMYESAYKINEAIQRKKDFISKFIIITAENKIIFVKPRSRKLIISTHKIDIPGQYMRHVADQYFNEHIFIQNMENQLFMYSGGYLIHKIVLNEKEQKELSQESSLYCMHLQDQSYVEKNNKRLNNSTALVIQTNEYCNFNRIQKCSDNFDDKNGEKVQQKDEYKAIEGQEYRLQNLREQETHQQDSGQLIAAIKINNGAYPEHQDWIIHISSCGISMYDNKGQLQSLHTNVCPTKTIHLSQHHLVILAKQQLVNVESMIYDEDEGDFKNLKSTLRFKRDGLYCIDLASLVKWNKLTAFKLSNAISGARDFIQFGPDSQRISFLTNWNKLSLLPFPHTNTVHFLGMRPKKHYLIWRQKNGFFCALDNKGTLSTWSMATGDLLYQQQASEFGVSIKHYEPYQANKKDTNYQKQNYQLTESTLQLLKHKHYKEQKSQIFKAGTQGQGNKIIDQFSTIEYKYKVLQLQLHQDHDEKYEMCGQERLVELFNFRFQFQEKIEINQSKQSKKQNKQNDDYYQDENEISDNLTDDGQTLDQDAQNLIFLSHNTKYLMIIQQGYKAEFYERCEPDEKTKEVSWKLRETMDRYPKLLQQDFSMQFLFSPNFHYYIRLDFAEKLFYIKSTIFAEKQIKVQIPVDQMYGEIKQSEELSIHFIKDLVKSFHFQDEEHFRIINNEGIDTLLAFDQDKIEIVSYSKRINWNPDYSKNQHLILGHACADNGEHIDLSTRMIEYANDHKVNTAFLQYFEKNHTTNFPKFKQTILPQEKIQNMYFHCRKVLSQIYKINHSMQWDSNGSYFICEQSFSVADWILIDFIINNQGQNYKYLDEEVFLRLFYNVLPGCNTFLHELVMKEDGSNIDVMRRGFKLAFKNKQELPIMRDSHGRTPLDYVLEVQNKEFKLYEQPILISEEAAIPTFKQKFKTWFKSRHKKANYQNENLLMANKLFDFIKNYSYLHSGDLLAGAVIEAIRREVPNIDEFLHCRCMVAGHQLLGVYGDLRTTNRWYKSFTYEAAMMKYEDGYLWFLDYSYCELPIWAMRDKPCKDLFYETGIQKKKRLFYLDIPLLHQQCNEGQQFISALCRTSKVSIFEKFPVQALVNRHWQRTKMFLITFFFLPYVTLLMTYIYWALVDIGAEILYQDHYIRYPWLRYVISVLCFYFLLFELKQLMFRGYKYFLDVWNYFEVIPLIVTLGSVNIETTPGFIPTYGFFVVQTVTIFVMFFKLMFFMRLFRATGYLVHAVVQVIFDMRYFLLIFFIVIFQFAFVLISINFARSYKIGVDDLLPVADPVGTVWEALKISYEVALGLYGDIAIFTTLPGQLFFLFATIIEVIVLLNVLIAIVSNSYQRIADDEIIYTYKERAAMVAEWQNILGGIFASSGRRTVCSFMFFALQDEDIEEDSWLSINTVPADEKAAELADNMDSDDEELKLKFENLTTRMEEEIETVMKKVEKELEEKAYKDN